MTDQVSYHVRILPGLRCRAVFHVLRNVVTTLVPADADLLALVKATTKNSSGKKADADIRQRWQLSTGVVALVVFDEVFLSIKDAATSDHYTPPVFTGLVHPRFVLLPV